MTDLLNTYLAVVNVGEVFESPNGRRFMAVVNREGHPLMGLVCVYDPLVKPSLGYITYEPFLRSGHDFGIVDKGQFFALYKKVATVTP